MPTANSVSYWSRGGEWVECPQQIMLVLESRGGEGEECPQPIMLVIGSRGGEGRSAHSQ